MMASDEETWFLIVSHIYSFGVEQEEEQDFRPTKNFRNLLLMGRSL